MPPGGVTVREPSQACSTELRPTAPLLLIDITSLQTRSAESRLRLEESRINIG